MSVAASVETWDRNAAHYDAQERLDRRAIETARRIAGFGPGEMLVDLGTGTGALLRAAAAGSPQPERVIGVDRSERMLAKVGELPEGFSTLVADACAVPLEDGCADVVSLASVLHLLAPPERAEVLAEARRLLRPGGRLVTITTWSPRRPVALALRWLALRWPDALGGLTPLDPTEDLSAAGFSITRRAELPHSGYPSLVLLAARA